MRKGKRNKKHTGEFKQKVVEDMRNNGLGQGETLRKYGLNSYSMICRWERIYLEEGAAGLYEERRGRAAGVRKGRPPNMEKTAEEDLIAENQRLRMENEYLKKLNALVQARELRERKRK